MSVQTVKFALKMGKETVVFEPESKRHMIRLVKAFLTANGAQARAVEVIKGIDALAKKEGMVYPSQTKQAIADRARRKARSISALDCALFIKSLPGTENLEGYNLALASFMEENDEGNLATAKTIQVASEAGGEYPVMSADLDNFAEMRKSGGQYTKSISRSRSDRRKLLSESLEVELENGSKHLINPRTTRKEARRARKTRRVNRRFRSYLERLSRGLVEPRPRTLSKALTLSTLCTHYRRARRFANKAYRQVVAHVDELLSAVKRPKTVSRYWNRNLVGYTFSNSTLRCGRFEELLADLLRSYFKKRKDQVTPQINEGCKVVAHLVWSNPLEEWAGIARQKVQIDLGHIVAKACK